MMAVAARPTIPVEMRGRGEGLLQQPVEVPGRGGVQHGQNPFGAVDQGQSSTWTA